MPWGRPQHVICTRSCLLGPTTSKSQHLLLTHQLLTATCSTSHCAHHLRIWALRWGIRILPDPGLAQPPVCEGPSGCYQELAHCSTSHLPQQVYEWRLEDSIFAPRRRECDSKSFFDTPEVRTSASPALFLHRTRSTTNQPMLRAGPSFTPPADQPTKWTQQPVKQVLDKQFEVDWQRVITKQRFRKMVTRQDQGITDAKVRGPRDTNLGLCKAPHLMHDGHADTHGC